MSSVRHIDQFLAGFSTGDAISNQALLMRDHLRSLGFKSSIYCEQFTEADSHQVLHFRRYHRRKNALLIYHHSFYTEILKTLSDYPAEKVLVFHNVTPPRFVEPYNSRLAESLARARDVLTDLKSHFTTALCPSAFNAKTLQRLGYGDVRIMPYPIEPRSLEAAATPSNLAYLRDGALNILFVGRIFPNKRHQDLLKTFHYFRRLEENSRLLLVGPQHPGVRGYTAELNNLSTELGVSDRVVFTNMVAPEDIASFYRHSHVFLSMSEHEGFFVPLVESMHCDLPVLAYASTVIPETLGHSGIMFKEKNFERVAEIMLELAREGPLRQAVLEGQRKRLEHFRKEASLEVFMETLRALGAA